MDNPQARLGKRKSEWTPITNMRNDRSHITTDPMEIKRITRIL